jgi:hypothetical protein
VNSTAEFAASSNHALAVFPASAPAPEAVPTPGTASGAAARDRCQNNGVEADSRLARYSLPTRRSNRLRVHPMIFAWVDPTRPLCPLALVFKSGQSEWRQGRPGNRGGRVWVARRALRWREGRGARVRLSSCARLDSRGRLSLHEPSSLPSSKRRLHPRLLLWL